MTEILRAFWKEKRPERIAVLVSGILFAVIFWIYEIPVEIAGYAFLLVILWNVIWFTLVFIRYEKRQRILEENQGKIRTEAGGFPEAESRESEMYQELIRQLYEEKKELESSVQIEKQELSDYYSMWVHQIKTPIAALGVLIQSGEELEEVQESPKAQELTRSIKWRCSGLNNMWIWYSPISEWVPQPPITPSGSAAWKKSSARQSANIPRCSL